MEEGGVLLVTLEAMACGKPVIAYKSGAIPEAVKHMRTGIIVPKGDVQSLSRAIELLINDSHIRSRIARNAYEACKNKFSVKTIVSTALKLYSKFY